MLLKITMANEYPKQCKILKHCIATICDVCKYFEINWVIQKKKAAVLIFDDLNNYAFYSFPYHVNAEYT